MLWKRCCVYRYGKEAAPPLDIPDGAEWESFSSEAIARLFGDDPGRAKPFARFLRHGALGVLVSVGGEWAAYGWLSLPDMRLPWHIALPPHIPRRCSRGFYWGFSSATRLKFRSRGLYSFVKRLLLREAFEREPRPEVLIDTAPDNPHSRRGVISTGFVEAGMLYFNRLKVPRLLRYPLGFRRPDEPHPPLPGKPR